MRTRGQEAVGRARTICKILMTFLKVFRTRSPHVGRKFTGTYTVYNYTLADPHPRPPICPAHSWRTTRRVITKYPRRQIWLTCGKEFRRFITANGGVRPRCNISRRRGRNYKYNSNRRARGSRISCDWSTANAAREIVNHPVRGMDGIKTASGKRSGALSRRFFSPSVVDIITVGRGV